MTTDALSTCTCPVFCSVTDIVMTPPLCTGFGVTETVVMPMPLGGAAGDTDPCTVGETMCAPENVWSPVMMTLAVTALEPVSRKGTEKVADGHTVDGAHAASVVAGIVNGSSVRPDEVVIVARMFV